MTDTLQLYVEAILKSSSLFAQVCQTQPPFPTKKKDKISNRSEAFLITMLILLTCKKEMYFFKRWTYLFEEDKKPKNEIKNVFRNKVLNVILSKKSNCKSYS